MAERRPSKSSRSRPRWSRWARRLAGPLRYPRRPIGSAALIRDGYGRVLLVRQTYRLDEAWFPPGGWVGRGETLRQAAARETHEEVGLRVTIGRLLAVATGPYGDASFLFEGNLVADGPLRLSDEIAQAAYFAPNRLPPLDDGTRRWLAEALAALGVAPRIVAT